MNGVLVLAAAVALAYGLWWLRRRFGVAGWWFVVAACSFFAAAGIVAEPWVGPEWSWNFARYGINYAVGEACIGVVCALVGFMLLSRRRTA